MKGELVVITVAECARHCWVRPGLLRQWLKQGSVPGVLLGETVQLTPAELAALRKRKW